MIEQSAALAGRHVTAKKATRCFSKIIFPSAGVNGTEFALPSQMSCLKKMIQRIL